MSFTLTAKGLSTGICNHPKPLISVVNIDKGETVWTTPPSFQTSMLCGAEPFYNEWRFGYEGEELPFQSALVHDRYYENRIAMEEAGNYKLVARFEDHSIEEEFQVR